MYHVQIRGLKNGGGGGSRTRVRNSLSLSHSQACLVISPTSKDIHNFSKPLCDTRALHLKQQQENLQGQGTLHFVILFLGSSNC